MIGSRLTLEEDNDHSAAAHGKAQHEQAVRNLEWLENHWTDLLPQARGKHLAIAGQEAFIADTAAEAWDWAGKTHPDDHGAFVQYVFPEGGPRIYANRRPMVRDP